MVLDTVWITENAMACSSTDLNPVLDSSETACKKIRLDTASDVSSSTDTRLGNSHQVPGDSSPTCSDTVEDKIHVTTSGTVSARSSQVQEDRVLCEQDVGIIEYISAHPGFTGIIKQRYTLWFIGTSS